MAMILTHCAACAKPLEHDASSRCVGCQTRYCSDRCLRYHAHRGDHDDECEEIANGGGAEQYHADKKYEEAVAVAVDCSSTAFQRSQGVTAQNDARGTTRSRRQ